MSKKYSLALSFILLGFSAAKADYVPMRVTGFNVDVIANGVGGPLTSTTGGTLGGIETVTAGQGMVFVASDYLYNSGCTPPPKPFPAGALINGVTPGVSFQLAAADSLNALRLSAGAGGQVKGTLAFDAPVFASEIYIAVLGTAGGGNLVMEVEFTDGSKYAYAQQGTKDWFNGTPYIGEYNRVDLSATTCDLDPTAGGPRLYEMTFTLPVAYWGKEIEAVSLSKGGGLVNQRVTVMAVCVKTQCGEPQAQPSGLSLTPASSSQINGTFTAAAPAPTGGYLVVCYPAGDMPVPPHMTYTAGALLGTGKVVYVGAATSFSASSLMAATPYDFYVYSMDANVVGTDCFGPVYRLTAPLSGTATTASCTGLSGTLSVGPSPANYTTLTAALSAINSTGVSGPVVLELQNNYAAAGETYPITINASQCLSAINTLTIRPAANATGRVITATTNVATIYFNGARYVTIDGVPGGSTSGSTLGVTAAGSNHATLLNIRNTHASGRAIDMNNGASYNTIRYCDLQGQNTTDGNLPTGAAGVVYIGPAGTGGNDNNTISYCNVHSTTATAANLPGIGIYSLGITNTGYTPNFNERNEISNCNIYDFFRPAANGISAGVELNQGVHAWTITGNSFFQTAARAFTGNLANQRGIWVVPYRVANAYSAGNGFVITDNYIGGMAPQCGGGRYTLSGAFTHGFRGITLEVRDSLVRSAVSGLVTGGFSPSLVRNNTIANILQTSSATTNEIFRGISVSGSGNIDIEGNTIGSASDTGMIRIAGSTASHMTGITISTSAGAPIFNIRKNIIGGLTLTNNGTHFTGIYLDNNGDYFIDSNLIGSETKANSIHFPSTGSNASYLRGISVISGNSGPQLWITNNTIANLTNRGTASATADNHVAGIRILTTNSNTIRVASIDGNIIRNLESSTYGGTNGWEATVLGIGINIASGTGRVISVSRNLIHSLVAVHTSARSGYGIYVQSTAALSGELCTFDRNFIHSLDWTHQFSTAYAMRGMEISIKDGALVTNNMIRLGIRPDGTPLKNPISILGIVRGTSTEVPNNFYHNSVYIGGAGVDAAVNHTAAFRHQGAAGTVDTVMNNIFMNERTNTTATGSGTHMSVWVNAITNKVFNNNLYWYGIRPGPPGTTNRFAGTSAGTTPTMLAAYTPGMSGWVSGDVNSVLGDSFFVAPEGTAATVDLHIKTGKLSPVESAGIQVPSVTEDFDGESRAAFTPVDIGADAGFFEPLSVKVNLNNSPVCLSDTIKLTAFCWDATATIGWSGPNSFTATGATVTIPNAGAAHAGIYRVWATSGSVTSDTVDTVVVLATPVTPLVSISANPATSVCLGTPVNFTAAPVDGGTLPVYEWRKNGIPVASGNSYTENSPAQNDIITCRMTSNAPCASPDTAISNVLTMTVSPFVTPSVDITVNTGSSICAGAPVTFTATPTNEGTTPVYQWRKDGIPVGGSGSTYNDNGLLNGEVITCRMTSNAACATPDSAISNILTMSVTQVVVPSVIITANSGTSLCPGTLITITAAPTNGGTLPVYEWRKNGVAAGSGNSYTDNSPAHNDVITCRMTSNAVCAIPDSALSNALTITITPSFAPSVSIAANPGTSICPGTLVTFTPTPTGGGTTPVYQWRKNGVAVSTGPTYSDNGLTNGQTITCRLMSNATCVSPDSAISNVLTMTVIPFVTPTVNITSNPGPSICAGTPVAFTAAPTNGGTTPVYQWRKNGVAVGTGPTYSDNGLTNGQTIICRMTSNATCASPDTALSNVVTMSVTPVVVPSLNITANPGAAICAGEPVMFNATPANGGTTPVYQWRKNGAPAGTGSSYTDNGITQGDVITCRLTSNAACAVPDSALSSAMTMTVNSVAIPTVSVQAGAGTTICQGDPATFTALPVNGGSAPGYQWYKNAVPTGTNSNVYNDNGLNNGDVITCRLSSSVTCAFPDTALSPAVTMAVISLAATITPPGPVRVCEDDSIMLTADASGLQYQWRLSGAPIPGATGRSYAAKVAGDYTVTVYGGLCIAATNVPVAVSVHAKPAPPRVTVNGDTLTTEDYYVSYQWYVNSQPVPGATGYRHIAMQAGIYYVMVTDSNGCTVNSVFYTKDDGVRISALSAQADAVHIYPNPASDMVYIRASFPVQVSVQAPDGRKIEIPDAASGIRLHDLPDGVYMISVRDQQGKQVKLEKLIKLGK